MDRHLVSQSRFNKIARHSALTLAGLFITLTLILEALQFAETKNFWGDEVTDILTTLPDSPRQMIFHKVENQVSASPFYFSLQHGFIKKILRQEQKNQKGLNWNLSFRIVPIAFLAVSALIGFGILASIHWLMAVLFLILLVNDHFLIWYAAETRIYASWLGASLIFYALVIKLALNPTRTRYLLGFLSGALLLIGVSISSPGQIAGAVLALLLFWWQQKHKISRATLIKLAVAIIIPALLYKFWSTHQKQFSFKYFDQPLAFYLSHFIQHTSVVVGGLKTSVWLLVKLVFLGILSQRRFKALAFQPIYAILGWLGLSQIALVPALYFLQIFSGYFFAERHVIFLVAIRALLNAGVGLAMLDILSLQLARLTTYRYRQQQTWLVVLIILAVAVDWFNWSVRPLVARLHHFSNEVFLPYCHGKVAITNAKALTHDAVFNIINQKRHRLECETQQRSVNINQTLHEFNPDWIYRD